MKSRKSSPKKSVRRNAPRKPGKRDENKDRTKKRILDSALKLFCQHGLERTTTRQISQKADIAEGTLFNYFKTKEDLALYFFHKETDALIEWYYGNAPLMRAPLPEKLFSIIHRQLEYMAPYEDFIGAVFFRSLQPNSKLNPLSLESQELKLKALKFIRQILIDAAEHGEIAPVGDLGAYVVGFFYLGMVTHWLHDGSRGKQKTLALLDHCLQVGIRLARKDRWVW